MPPNGTMFECFSSLPAPAAIAVAVVLTVVVILQEVKEHGTLALRAPWIILGEHDIDEAAGTGS